MSLSLANLCFLRHWSAFLTFTRADRYYMKLPPAPAQYCAAITNTLLLAGLFVFLMRLARRAPGPLAHAARLGVLVSLLIPLNAARELASDSLPYLRGPLIRVTGTAGAMAIFAGLGLAVVAVVLIWPRRIYAAALAALLVLAPFAPVTLGQAVWAALTYDESRLVDKPLAPPLPRTEPARPRIVWIVFDELDERLLFDARQKGLELPEFDRFRNASVYAVRAYPPSSATLVSLPSLIDGQRLRDAVPISASILQIRYQHAAQPIQWGTQPNVFSRARALGFNTALVGWFLPYGRILNKDLTMCRWFDFERPTNSIGRTFRAALPNQLRSLFETSLFSPFGQSLAVQKRVRNYQGALEAARAAASDNSIGLCLLHLQPPHTPNAYSRQSGQFDLSNASVRGYYDGLALADRTLGILRRTMEEAGVWATSTVLVSSDHWFRDARVLDGKQDRRVPFLLKLPGQSGGVCFEPPFDTTLTQSLLLSILRREVAAPADALAWLDRHHGDIALCSNCRDGSDRPPSD